MNKLLYIVGRFKLLYRIPPDLWLVILAGFLAFWTVLMFLFSRRVPLEKSQNPALIKSSFRKNRFAIALNIILMLLGLTIILLVTFVRQESSVHQVVLIPLRVLFGLRAPGDYWHVTVMNIVLYVPFACGLCFVMGKKHTHPVCTTVLICFGLAFAAEARQYILGSGTSEVDDVLMNTLGAFLGTLPYVFSCKMILRL